MQWRAARGLAAGLMVTLAWGCASSGARPRPFPVPSGASDASEGTLPLPAPPAGTLDGYAIARTALALRGVPYRLGGTDTRGFDCSGLVQYVFARHGIGLPRVVRDQYGHGVPVRLDALEPGDLVFFETSGGEVSHVAIAIGGDQFVHAPNARGSVRINRLTSGYWGERAVAARRMVTLQLDTQ